MRGGTLEQPHSLCSVRTGISRVRIVWTSHCSPSDGANFHCGLSFSGSVGATNFRKREKGHNLKIGLCLCVCLLAGCWAWLVGACWL